MLKAVISSKLNKEETAAQKNGNVVALKQQDKRKVLTLSTLHAGHVIEGTKRNRHGEPIKKPDCLCLQYPHARVDRLDQLLSYYSPLRKTLKWYRKVVLQMPDTAVNNAFLFYRKAAGSRHHI